MATILNGIKCKILQKGYYRMTLDFGNTYSNGSFHKGIDLTGNPEVNSGYDYVCAFADGTVIGSCNTMSGHATSSPADMGNYVIIDHGNGWRTRYMHMTKGSVKVKTGNKVKAGQVLGYIGDTGNSNGRHLHFDLSKAGNVSGGRYLSNANRTYFDPKPFLRGTKTIGANTTVSTSSSTSTSNTKTGTYKVRADVNVRAGAGTKYARVYYNGFTSNARAQIIQIKGREVDYFPAGMTLTISAIDSTGKWGKCPSGWVSMHYLTKK